NCKIKPAHGSHRYCGKTCASIASRQKQPYSPPVLGYGPGYQGPPSPYTGPYVQNGPPPGFPGYPQGYSFPPSGPSYPNHPVSPGQPRPWIYGPRGPGGSRPPPQRQMTFTPDRARQRARVAAPDFSSEDEYPSESEEDRRHSRSGTNRQRGRQEDYPSD
ncbi:hypothetical protein FRB90_010799, partial [Tulasnella sp. 427]